MRKLFERMERNHYLPRSTPGHGFDGFFQTSMSNTTSVGGAAASVLETMATSLGDDPKKVVEYLNRDPNALASDRDNQVGIFGLPRHAKNNGQRYSSRDYILETINSTEYKLTLSQNSLATRVLFDTSGPKPKATGLAYLAGKSLYRADPRHDENAKGEQRTAIAKREVIVSGGCFNSPQILKLSGIGPAEELKKFNITVLVDSPGVGTNMQDNQEMPIVGQLQAAGEGFGGTGCVMVKTKHSPYDERDMFLMQGAFAFRGFWPSNQSNRALPSDPTGTYSVSMVKQHPQNRAGTVKLLSSDPRDTPEINFNLYKEGRETDIGAMEDTIAWVRSIYKAIKAPLGPVTPKEPPCPVASLDPGNYCNDAKIDEDWIEAQTFGHHPTSTCAIGGDSNKNAVLDSGFRVRGVTNLRVVDASAFPRIPGVFPVVATFMLGQKASDVIIADAKATT
jgi:choline dehydrogenase